MIRFKTAEVVLHVQPFKFSLLEQKQEFAISEDPASIEIYNAGNIYARPIMSITATGSVSFALNGSDILVIDFGETSQTIIINCEELNAYDEQNILQNRLVTGNYDNIKLNKGSNEISLSGDVTAFTIEKYSRWI